MSWKVWPYWLKGVILGMIIAVLGIVIVYLIGGYVENYWFLALGFPIIPISSLLYLLFSLLDPFDFISYIGFPFFVLQIIVGYAIYGFIIGWIYGKINNRND